ncbi:hypothetical protein J4573_12745 [Actinomadura barringtoniae]|uniref:Uncharacterized protein n=1 Tax=Actinomadura barringtoniae TaxID=1427535 RepID=A0A939PEZ1_9ACTN|nr:hypothetical protein [Actinomadura barringtoniae]MBO2447964.1 hypothetical protein [Actinomadura barringtoniae]
MAQRMQQWICGAPASVREASQEALVGLVTLEGEFWGVDDEPFLRHRKAYLDQANAYLDALDDDAWLVILSVHW